MVQLSNGLHLFRKLHFFVNRKVRNLGVHIFCKSENEVIDLFFKKTFIRSKFESVQDPDDQKSLSEKHDLLKMTSAVNQSELNFEMYSSPTFVSA